MAARAHTLDLPFEKGVCGRHVHASEAKPSLNLRYLNNIGSVAFPSRIRKFGEEKKQE